MAFLAAALGIGGALLGGVLGNESADKAADAQIDATREGIAEQRRQFEELKRLNAPTQYYGDQANALLAANFGISPYGAGSGGPSYNQPYQDGARSQAYFGQYPDVGQAWQSDAYGVRSKFKTPDAYADWHYGTFGRGEGRQAPAGLMSVGGGAYQQGQATPFAQDAQGSLQDQAYGRFLESGEARSMLETTQADMDMMTGQFGAAGKAVSGSHLAALNDRNRRNTSAAYGNYSNALRSMSGAGQVANETVGNAGMNFGNQVAAGQNAIGGTRASSYAQQGKNNANALGNALGGVNWGKLGARIGGMF